MTISEAQKIHCIGIGGIGVSALAALWRAQGKIVSGSDADAGGHKAENAADAELVIYSDAVPDDNVERVAARARGISELSYAQALGEVSREYRTIVVTGTHGKSTTTAMLGLILETAGLDPLVLVGSKVPGWPLGNLRVGKGEWFVVEGDDYREHFLELQPYAVVVTSIEWDHPDYFRDLAHTVQSFVTLAEKAVEDGFIVLNEDDSGCRLLHSAIPRNRRIIQYGKESEMFLKLQLKVPGDFNRYNATAAAIAVMELGVPRALVEKVAREFRGIWRRFEIVGEHTGATIISDYGHHPTAIRETMKAAREAYPGRRLVLVYQPHQHSRTKHLFTDFVEVLKDAADLTIVSEIYAVKGRMEERDVSSRDIVEAIKRLSGGAMKNVLYGGNLEETKRIAIEQIKSGDVVIFMGAGDIDQLARGLI